MFSNFLRFLSDEIRNAEIRNNIFWMKYVKQNVSILDDDLLQGRNS